MNEKNKTSVGEDGKFELNRKLSWEGIEQYKLLRTNLKFTLPADEKCPVIGITSPFRSEGKSTTSMNLAHTMSEDGSKVLLIDGDLRLPTIAKKLNIPATPGLTDLLVNGSRGPLNFVRNRENETWFVLPSGDLPPNPSELLSSSRMEILINELRKVFDYIIIDLPPVNIVSDAVAISKLLTGTLVIVRENVTSKYELKECIRKLQLADTKILGMVMNVTGSGTSKYGKTGKYGKYSKYYSYYYKSRDDD